MRGSCGPKDWTSKPLPCPSNEPASEDGVDRDLLIHVCGEEFAEGPTCCNKDQVEVLQSNLDQAENLLASCPACRNNFRKFWCTFTCHPDQATFLNVTSTQKSVMDQTAVQSVDFFVSERFGEGFYDSCKSIQVGATNGYAMDLIGGGAKDYHGFFKFMGDEKDMGSPFQINFPEAPPEFTPFDARARNCADEDLGSRCTCIDCPTVCQTLPPVPPPGSEPSCHVGSISCLSFSLTILYGLCVIAFVVGYIIPSTIRKRKERLYERVALSADGASDSTPMSPRSHSRGLVGASSLAHQDVEESSGNYSDSRHLGRGASLLDPIETVQPRQYRLNAYLRRTFYRLGFHTASHPWATFAIMFAAMALLNLGWNEFKIETDPVRLWVAPNSESRIQKEYFDEHFGPFYRPEQIYVTVATTSPSDLKDGDTAMTMSNEQKPPVLSWDHLKYWMNIESEIRQLTSPKGYTLDDVCFKPLGPDGACVVQSVGGWFGNELEAYDPDTWQDRLLHCANSPVECRPDFQQPLAPQYVLGGIPEVDGAKRYLDSKALVVNIVVSNSLDEEVLDKATDWERTLRAYLEDLSERITREAGLEIAFSTGVSLEEELNKSANTDVRIVVLSYLAMFFYVSLTLGNGFIGRDEEGVSASLARWAKNFPKLFRSSASASIDSTDTPTIFPRLPRKLFIGSKVFLGLFAISLVILSVSSSVGFFSILGVRATLIIAEVIPFLVLAVGVDNVFILVHEMDRQNILHGPNASAAPNFGGTTPLSPTLSRARAPFEAAHSQDDSVDAESVPLYLPVEERVARTLAKMGPSILLSTITEFVAFALGAIVPMPAVRNFALYAAGSVLLNALLQVSVFISAMALDQRRIEANRVDCFPCVRLPSRIALLDPPQANSGLGMLGKFIRRHYAPFLLKPIVKGFVLLSFTGLLVCSVISIQHIELGLDQRLAVPSDSYLVKWFDSMDDYLEIGPPVYFVVEEADVEQRPTQQKLCGRFTTCDDFSVANILEAERKRTESSFIADPAAPWLDDFMNWLNPTNGKCCRINKRDPTKFCTDRQSPRICKPCFEDHEPAWNITMDGLPQGEEFMKYLRQWIVSPTSEDCPLGGAASYGTALSFDEDETKVIASHFRTSHKPIKSQADYIDSFYAAHRIADEISESTGLRVFPYSYHYVFFDQYAHIVAITEQILGLGLAAVLIVTALLLGSWRTGSIVTGVVALTVVTVMGVMGVWRISLNAISLVNLVISLGIAVEFCAHVARAFMSSGSGLPIDHPAGQKERDERMWTALVDVGPSVLSGITFTKLIGMSVLALTHSKILEIYYFRMWITLIVSGALHGLVLLPVVLSLAGGPGFPLQEADEEWMSHAIRNDYEYTPFLADDDSAISD
ncbi:multidrug efflux transporter AcrB transmembrane domain-containing protein [Phanerochaete sordida]|uniref:Multidrug efflux transporter AcrB transmembrane domain-containing protein n=1 Tax=Phanerochaete sordida TaxID=48140 RepID=A0A9P3L7Y1_9APHY|nr:multidrug efflux transporter AcrB transmembrane domain-containing protein [Phanerochaete sordida]